MQYVCKKTSDHVTTVTDQTWKLIQIIQHVLYSLKPNWILLCTKKEKIDSVRINFIFKQLRSYTYPVKTSKIAHTNL